MKHRIRNLLAGALLFTLALTHGAAIAASQTLTGSATHPGRGPVPPGAAFEATLELLPEAGAPVMLGRFFKHPAGNPPYHFEIGYDGLATGRQRLTVRLLDGQRPLYSAVRELDGSAHGGAPLELAMAAGLPPPPTAPDTPGADPSESLVGMFSHITDAGSILLCGSGERLPVANGADNDKLVRAYGNTRRNAGESVLVEVRGHIVERLPVEGPLRRTLVVDKFVSIQAQDSCPARVVLFSLTNTYWKLTRLGTTAVVPEPGKREAHLIFKDQRVSGSGGCNSMSGSYTLDGESLKFGPVAGTRMACPAGMDEESRLGLAMSLVVRWKIYGKQLDLIDSQGNTVASLEGMAIR